MLRSAPRGFLKSLLSTRLTLEEKASLLAAVDWWRTPTIRRDGVFVPHIKMSDGPNGARGESYVSGITAACFPCSTAVGATFDPDGGRRLGREIAREARTKAANVLLAPTMNIIRSPLGGRNYETYSEDLYLIGTLASAFVRGCQAEGIAATPKHFVANESERYRTKMTSQVDCQTLRELYMLPFQLVMRDADPWCFMTSYNRVNGEYCADSHWLLEEVL
ncbi:glycoside hydrolase [Colletotrichum sublineola]|nr:glycoside hydrolase [Colletotrichum sublineola]